MKLLLRFIAKTWIYFVVLFGGILIINEELPLGIRFFVPFIGSILVLWYLEDLEKENESDGNNNKNS